ncbi:MAG: hypothetical protein V3V52_13915 [Candidatus Adiutricales bacterium]
MPNLWIKRKDKTRYIEPQTQWLLIKRLQRQIEPQLRNCVEPMSGCLVTPFFK